MRTEAEERQAVIDAARSWIGTPFHDCAAVRGAGIDCANLLARSFEEAGLTGPIDTGVYPPAWFLHRDEERFAEFVLRYAREITESEAGPGDIVLYKYGRCFAHGAIIVEWPKLIVHAYKSARIVTEYRPFDGDLYGRPTRFFTIWPRT